MWEKLRGLSGGAKAGIVGGVVLLAAAGVGLGIWQPWNQQPEEEAPNEPNVVQQEPAAPQKQPEKGLSLQVNGKKVACALYEGDGWSIYVPEGWTAEGLSGSGALFSSGDGAQLSVQFEPDGGYTGKFVNLSAGEGGDRLLQFYDGSGKRGPSVVGNADAGAWEQYGKLLVALARTLTVGDEKPFAESYVIPEEPDWQRAEGLTVLFLDKDGYIIDEEMQSTIESYMRSWPAEDREIYTGQYRINSMEWAGRYTGLARNEFVDVFRADVQYQVAEGGEERLKEQDGGVQVTNGWASGLNGVFLAVFHDGGSVAKTQGIVTADVRDWTAFVALLK